MATELFLVRSMGALRPADAFSEAALQRIPQGQTVKAVVTSPRNIRFHNKFFSLLEVLYPHQTLYPTMDAFRAAVTVALGHGEKIRLPDGRVIIIPGSIAFAKMDGAAFEQFMARFFDLVETRILPGIDRADVLREWQEVMSGYQNSLASYENMLRGDANSGAPERAQRGGAPQRVSGGVSR